MAKQVVSSVDLLSGIWVSEGERERNWPVISGRSVLAQTEINRT